MPYRSLGTLVVLSIAGLAADIARADINGFGDFSGFTLNQRDSGSAPSVSPNSIQITSGPSQYRSIFYNTPQPIGSFSASLDYRVPAGTRYMGITFVIHNDPTGVHALGTSDLVSYGYSGIHSSVGVTLESEFVGNTTRTGMYTNGVLGAGSLPSDPVILNTDHTIHLSLSYNGSILTENLLDTITGDTFSSSAFLNIPSLVGGPTAFVGITADSWSGANGANSQFLTDLRFGAIPAPGTFAVAGLGLGMVGRRRR